MAGIRNKPIAATACTFIAAAVCAFCAVAQAAVITPSVTDPRAFGHTIGDTLTQRIDFDLRRPAALDHDSLPKTGRKDAWIALNKVAVSRRRGWSITHYEVRLTYQLINAPGNVRTLSLPALTFKTTGASPRELPVAQWFFTAAPLTPPTILARGDLDELRPDVKPPLLPTAALEARLAAYGAAAAAIILYLLIMRFGVPFTQRRHGPFARASRDIARMTRKTDDVHAFRGALAALHRAFNEAAGHSVFAGELDGFFAAHPRFAPLRADVERFFDLSQQEFFDGGNNGARDPRIVLNLARRCRDRERMAA
jgi:mxaA protein